MSATSNSFLPLLALIHLLVSGGQAEGLQDKGAQQQDFTLSLDVQLVLLNVTVVDRKGRFMPGLKKEQFQIWEDKALQEIQIFHDHDVPVTIGLVVDSSGSMRENRKAVNAAALAFVQSCKPEDEMFVVNFNEEVELGLPPEEPFSNQTDKLESALARLVVRGQTALYDAIWLGLEHLQKGRHDKKALVVISDGADNASSHGFRETLTAAQKSQAAIYSIGIYEANSKDRDPKSLRQISKATGGESVFPESIEDVEAVCRHFARTIRSQYTLAYSPSNASKDGTYRTIRVVASAPGEGKLEVRTREGYYAPLAK
ncbi:MAG: VWA domain-containing protein [Acidobacteriota bacterium]